MYFYTNSIIKGKIHSVYVYAVLGHLINLPFHQSFKTGLMCLTKPLRVT